MVINSAVFPPIFLVAFTGHRPGDGPGRSREELEAVRPAIRQALTELEDLAKAQNGTIEIYSSIASGSDTIACEVADDMGLPLLAGVELVLVAVALAFMLSHHHLGTQKTWLHCRFATELLRSIEATSGILDPLHPQSKHYPPHWHRFALSATLALLRERPPTTNFTKLKAHYLDKRIDNQLNYFRSKLAKATPLARCFGNIASWSAWAAFFAVLGAFSYKLFHFGDHQSTSPGIGFFVYLLPIALPLLAGMASSLQTSLDIGRRKVRYREMIDNLESSCHWIEQLQTPLNLTLAAARVESVLLDEQIEWMAAAEAGQGH